MSQASALARLTARKTNSNTSRVNQYPARETHHTPAKYGNWLVNCNIYLRWWDGPFTHAAVQRDLFQHTSDPNTNIDAFVCIKKIKIKNQPKLQCIAAEERRSLVNMFKINLMSLSKLKLAPLQHFISKGLCLMNLISLCIRNVIKNSLQIITLLSSNSGRRYMPLLTHSLQSESSCTSDWPFTVSQQQNKNEHEWAQTYINKKLIKKTATAAVVIS